MTSYIPPMLTIAIRHASALCALAALTTLACGRKGDAPAEGTGTPTIQGAPDDIVPESAAVSDTTPGVPVTPATPGSPGTSSTAPAPTGGAIIGYDSAFGPSYELDSAGRPIPIKKRKP
jgi:hypothetical protein